MEKFPALSTATKILRNRIVLIFDFDGTLGPNTNRILFKSHDLDYEEFGQAVERYKKEKMWQGAHNTSK